jgi:hypothetical protein
LIDLRCILSDEARSKRCRQAVPLTRALAKKQALWSEARNSKRVQMLSVTGATHLGGIAEFVACSILGKRCIYAATDAPELAAARGWRIA